ncbi:MAG: YceI family protein [Psychrobium sp.]|nr:YceI family protein [Psychrobium sp.]
MTLRKTLLASTFGLLAGLSSLTANAADYKLDVKGTHAFIQFKVSHLGYSWIIGGFNKFDGKLSYDNASESMSKVTIEIDTKSIDSNHARRDKHIRGKDFLNVAKFPKATFVSTSYKPAMDNKAVLTGDFTLHGVTKSIDIAVTKLGEGSDPWGGERVGFEGTTSILMNDYGIAKFAGSASGKIELFFTFEGIKVK